MAFMKLRIYIPCVITWLILCKQLFKDIIVELVFLLYKDLKDATQRAKEYTEEAITTNQIRVVQY